MSNFLYKIESIKKENFIEIILYYTNEKKETILEYDKLHYSLKILKNDFLNLENKYEIKKEYKNIRKEKVVDFIIETETEFLNLKNYFKSKKIKCYELDLKPEQNYLIEKDLKILNGDENKINFKYLILDIETIGKDFDNQEITLISTYSKNENMSFVYVNKEKIKDKNKIKNFNPKDFSLKIFKNEKEMLKNFLQDIKNFSPQIISGWNVIDFDFLVIKNRCKKLNLQFNFSKYNGITKMRIINDFFRESYLEVPGIIIIDSIFLLKKNFINFPDFKLSTVAKEVLKDDKINLEDDNLADENIQSKMDVITNMFYKNPIKLIKYNFKDSLLVSNIIEKLKLLNLMKKRSIISNTPILNVKSPVYTLDLMYLKKLHKLNLIANTNFNFSSGQSITGAFVMNPEIGFHNNIFVFDFKSLYPSLIMTFNLDPFTYDIKGEIIAPNNAKFSKKIGILPEIISNLAQERQIAKDEKNFIKSNAIKVTMNSFYGAIASPKSRFYNNEIGEAITGFARFFIKLTRDYIQNNKIGKVIYGDTDSVFIKFEKIIGDKKTYSKKIENKINIYLKNYIEKNYKINSKLEIEAEKIYSNFFIASKKRYVGFNLDKQKLEFVGLEYVRGDWTNLAKKFQKKIIEMIFDKKKIIEMKIYIYDFINKLENGKFDNDLEYWKKLTKPLKDYTKTTPPHVKAAREIKDFDNRLVKYIMTIDGPKHISKRNKKTKYDYKHYVEKQLIGVCDDIFNGINIDIKDLIYKKTQKSLTGFLM